MHGILLQHPFLETNSRQAFSQFLPLRCWFVLHHLGTQKKLTGSYFYIVEQSIELRLNKIIQ